MYESLLQWVSSFDWFSTHRKAITIDYNILPSSVVETSVDVSLESRPIWTGFEILFKSLFCRPSQLSLFPLAPLLYCDLNFLPRSKIFFGLRHQSCSGRMQFQSTQGNHKATPISMVRKTMSCVFRLVRLTLKCFKYVY